MSSRINLNVNLAEVCTEMTCIEASSLRVKKMQSTPKKSTMYEMNAPVGPPLECACMSDVIGF